MKQYITVEQMNEIGYEKATRLIRTTDKIADRYIAEWKSSTDEGKNQLELSLAGSFTIGTLIKLVGIAVKENEDYYDMKSKNYNNIDNKDLFDIRYFPEYNNPYLVHIWNYKGKNIWFKDLPELCDNLWEALKYLLESEE